MLGSDLSAWAPVRSETVGERRQRKAKEKALASADTPPERLSTPKSASTLTGTLLRKKSYYPRRGTLNPTDEVRDPEKQLDYTLSGSLSPRLPSGALLDNESSITSPSSSYFVLPEPKSNNRIRIPRIPFRVKCDDPLLPSEPILEIQQLSPTSYISRNTVRSIEDSPKANPPKYNLNNSSYSVKISSRSTSPLSSTEEHTTSNYATNHWTKTQKWHAPASWNTGPDRSNSNSSSTSLSINSGTGQNNTQFCRFVLRMDHATPEMVLRRLMEDELSVDIHSRAEMELEKSLWALSFLRQLMLQSSICEVDAPDGSILCLFGDIANLCQISAHHASQIHHLSLLPLSCSARVTQPSAIRTSLPSPFHNLPYSRSSLSQIYSPALATSIPLSAILPMLRECYRVLRPGGQLWIRIMDPLPNRKCTGPELKGWMENRIVMGLEEAGGCTRPTKVIPECLGSAGFMVRHVSSVTVQSVASSFDPIPERTKCLAGREIWKGIWGTFVDKIENEVDWWWEDERVMMECESLKTEWEIQEIEAIKVI